jgi:hypothetical protein
MTVGERGKREGVLARVISETAGQDHAVVELLERRGIINADLTVGPNVAAAAPLKASEGLSCPGVKLHGSGFIVTPAEAEQLGLGRIPGLDRHIRQYRNGRDLTSRPRGVMVIDLFGTHSGTSTRAVSGGLSVGTGPGKAGTGSEEGRHSRRRGICGQMVDIRKAAKRFPPGLNRLARYISTVETSKHRFFVFLDTSILPDNMLVNIALDDAYFLGVLSSRVHVAWALAAGGTLEDRPRYNKTRCFEPFPFPITNEQQRERIRSLGETLDAHRKRQQQLFSALTITGMYNVLESCARARNWTKGSARFTSRA